MKRIALSVFMCLLTGVTYAWGEDARVRVGFIASFSGEAAIYGIAAKNGFELALEEIGREWIEVMYEDDEFLPKKTVSAFQKLTSSGDVDLIITVGSTPSNAVAPLAQAKKVPLIAWASDRQVSRGRPLVIRSYPSGYAEGETAAKEAIRRGFDSFALFISNNDYAQSWKRGFVGSIPKEQITFDGDLTGDLSDFKPFLLRARMKNVKQYVVCLDPGKSGILAKQAAELRMSAPIFGCEYLHSSEEIDAAAGALDDAWFPTISVSEDFRRRYVARFGNDSVISGAANHYDLAYLLQRASKSLSQRTDFVEALLRLGVHEGAVGTFAITLSENERYFDIPLVIREVRSIRS